MFDILLVNACFDNAFDCFRLKYSTRLMIRFEIEPSFVTVKICDYDYKNVKRSNSQNQKCLFDCQWMCR